MHWVWDSTQKSGLTHGCSGDNKPNISLIHRKQCGRKPYQPVVVVAIRARLSPSVALPPKSPRLRRGYSRARLCSNSRSMRQIPPPSCLLSSHLAERQTAGHLTRIICGKNEQVFVKVPPTCCKNEKVVANGESVPNLKIAQKLWKWLIKKCHYCSKNCSCIAKVPFIPTMGILG